MFFFCFVTFHLLNITIPLSPELNLHSELVFERNYPRLSTTMNKIVQVICLIIFLFIFFMFPPCQVGSILHMIDPSQYQKVSVLNP